MKDGNKQDREFPILSEIDFGRPDANAEHDTSIKNNSIPLYQSCFVHPPISFKADFDNGTRFFIVGQKGVGKTAFLRVMYDNLSKLGYSVEYIVFNERISQDEQIYSPEDILVDREDISKTTYHLHSIKRILMAIILKKIYDNYDDIGKKSLIDRVKQNESPLIWRIIHSAPADIVRKVCDDITDIVSSSNIDVKSITKGKVKINPEQLIKRKNDSLLKELIGILKESKNKYAIFIDEIQYVYSDDDAYREGATLVRDMIVSALNLNRAFIAAKADVTIYLAMRSEFLNHPIIAKANVAQSIESYGEKLFWRYRQRDHDDPLISIVTKRIKIAHDNGFTNSDLFKYYMANITPKDLISYTWRKPRDVIRFFSKAREIYPGERLLSQSQISDVLTQYSLECWEDLKPAAATLLNEKGLVRLQTALEEIAPDFNDPNYGMPAAKFIEKLKPIYDSFDKEIKNSQSPESLFYFLYSIGIFYSYIKDGNLKRVSFACLGHQKPYSGGFIRLHRTLVRAFAK
ncbi:P-loop ATPase, Sll1717 family [Azospirillum sp. B4]|uniref:P-loop ATPase, Sll1717 family n=1 Tax=Azospirillum sp. B4 TaxID=95605 RepID=UPI0003464848|nr:hypothetical protein [Azospirillum sp. B4]